MALYPIQEPNALRPEERIPLDVRASTQINGLPLDVSVPRDRRRRLGALVRIGIDARDGNS